MTRPIAVPNLAAPLGAHAIDAADKTPTPRETLNADLTLLALTVGWGSTFTVVHGALDHASPGAFLTARFAIATVAAALLARKELRDTRSLVIGAALGVLIFVGFALQTWGLHYTTPTRSGFLTGLSVVLVPLLRALVFRRAAHPSSYLGAAIATVGLFVMSARSLATGGPTLLGDALTLLCAVAFALNLLFTEGYAASVRPAAATAAQIATVCLFSALTLPFEPVRFEAASTALWLALLVTGVGNSAISFFLQLKAQAKTTAIRAALIFTLEPLFCALFAHFFADEPLTRDVLQGGALILCGNLAAELWPRLSARRRAGQLTLEPPR